MRSIRIPAVLWTEKEAHIDFLRYLDYLFTCEFILIEMAELYSANTSEMPRRNADNHQFPPCQIPNQETYIAKIENTMAAIQDQDLTQDPRYSQLDILKCRLTR